jgi:hypothetical protein
MIKWAQPSADLGSTKRDVLGEQEGNGSILVRQQKVYSCFAGARSNNISLFFY